MLPRSRRPGVALLVLLALEATGALAAPPAALDLQGERTEVSEWRARRVEALTNDSGWLTLTGLFWLKEGENSFGRAPDNALVLENPALPEHCGTFRVSGRTVRFTAAAGSAVTAAGRPVSSLELTPDAGGQPTVLATGPLRFYLIERAGNLGVRVRDLNNPHRTGFRGLSYFPVSTDWVFDARFEPHEPTRHIRIINILGMEQEYVSPGAVVFAKDGREWRLETVLEEPDDQVLFIMFADATSGHETYGGGRFLYVPLPSAGRTRVDFNKAYNPPCALNDFATCPLPPPQNRLGLRVEAGEKTYAGGHAAESVRPAISRAGAGTARSASAP